MSSDNIAVRVEGLGKCYQIYDRPRDRLRQAIMPKLQALTGRATESYYREFWALRNVSFEVGRGETVGIIGRNGSGKSTLLQVICSTLTPTTGLVQTRGRVAALLELGAGFNPEFTGRENVYMNGTVLGLSQAEIDARFDDIAAFADIGDFIEQPVKHYSSGMYARLAFAVAISVDPDILIVDEALSVGDELFQRKCFARIEQIKRNGGSILLVSHAASTVVSLCDRVVLMHQGERLLAGRPKLVVGYYQKLMSAPREAHADLIKEITEFDKNPCSSQDSAPRTVKELSGSEEQSISIELESEFDTNLKSRSAVIYESNGAAISQPRILNLDGTEVNQLVHGKRYVITYDVRFFSTYPAVRLNCMIKTLAGIELGGGTYPHRNTAGVTLEGGKQYGIRYEFECGLNPGTYFINCGVSNAGQTLHRILDALVFRVLADGDTFSNGLVDFKVISSLLPLGPASGGDSA